MVKARKSRCAMSTTASTSSGRKHPSSTFVGLILAPSLCRLYLPSRKVCRQTDHHSPRQGRVAGVAGETDPAGRCPWPDPDRDGSDLPLWRESLSGTGTAWVSTVFLASRANASVSSATRLTRQDGPARCDDDRPRALERGSTGWLYPERSGRHKLANWCASIPSSPTRQRALKTRSKLW